MLTYKTFRYKLHPNITHDIDKMLNALPLGTMIEGYVAIFDELIITVSNYNPHAAEIRKEEARLGNQR